jgi:hypothetical protein
MEQVIQNVLDREYLQIFAQDIFRHGLEEAILTECLVRVVFTDGLAKGQNYRPFGTGNT